MNSDTFPIVSIVFIISFIVFIISFVGGSINQGNIVRKEMEQQAVATHNAHYVLNETNGSSTFQWNNK